MKTIRFDIPLSYPLAEVWNIFADITRCDWVPGVDGISRDGDVRSFEMAGIGEVQEQIITLDHEHHLLQYSAIKTPSDIDHHLATIQLTELPESRGCQLTWTTEIEPDQFAGAIEQAMVESLAGLQKVLCGEH